MDEHDCVPIELYLWTLRLDLYFTIFLKFKKYVPIIPKYLAVQKQFALFPHTYSCEVDLSKIVQQKYRNTVAQWPQVLWVPAWQVFTSARKWAVLYLRGLLLLKCSLKSSGVLEGLEGKCN